MAEPSETCPQCGLRTVSGIRFCGQCGFDFTKRPSRVDPKRTMVGMAISPLSSSGVADVESREPAKTLVDPIPKGSAPGAMNKTILGTPAPKRSPKKGQSSKKMNRTMLGMPITDLQHSTGEKEPSSAVEPKEVSSSSTPAASKKPAVSNRTMLGAAPPVLTPQAPVAGTSKPSAVSNRTMLGAAPPLVTPTPMTPPARSVNSNAVEGEVSKTTSKVWVWPLLITMLLLSLGVGGFWWYQNKGRPTVRASIEQTENGERLLIDIPGASPATKARFEGQEQPLAAGRARFSLLNVELQLGENTLHVDVIEPSGEVEQVSVVLFLRYRVRADLSALQSESPQLRIVVDAMPGASVTLDEESISLDSTGHGALEFGLEAEGDASMYERTVRYRIVSSDQRVDEGEVRTRIPYATLHIDQPGERTITDKDRVELIGAVDVDAQVTLEGQNVELQEGRFVTHLALSELGEREYTLVVQQPGKVPRRKTFKVQRVADLATEAAAYPVDTSLTYARISRNPESYRGQHVSFDGRVYNIDVHEGRTVIQMVSRDCPRGQRCPLWVAFGGTSDIEMNDWVRAIGQLEGEQQFRSPSGEVLSVPRIDAVFVLPIVQGSEH